MKKTIDKKYLALGLTLGFFIITIIFTCTFTKGKEKEKKDNWVLRSYENTVVLMNNNEVIEVFGDIMVETLPKEDIKHLENGIPFLTKDEALMAIEDYDG